MGKQVYVVLMYIRGKLIMEVFEHDVDAEKYMDSLQKVAEIADLWNNGFPVRPALYSALVRDDELDISGQHFHVLRDTDDCSPLLSGKQPEE